MVAGCEWSAEGCTSLTITHIRVGKEQRGRSREAIAELFHVVDISHPDFEEQINVVDNTLKELGCADKPKVMVFNKIDNYKWTEKEPDDLTPATKENITLDELEKTWMAKLNDNCIFISAREKMNVEELRNTLYTRVRELHVQKYPYNDFLYPID